MTTLEDIYSSLAAHMIAGLMVHDQMASAYYFLNLKGYGKCQVYHYWCENKNYQCLKKHYMKYHCKLIRDQQIADPKIIPSN